MVLYITNQQIRFAQVLNQTPKFSIMKKLALVLTVFTASIIGAKAQEGLTFGVGLNAALPIGDFHQTHTFGIGAHIQAEYPFSEQFKGVFTTGYTSFFGKSVDVPGFGSVKFSSVGQIPFLAGGRFYPSTQFFVGAQIGYGIFTGGGSSTNGFEYRPQIGYDAGQFQIIGCYDGTSVTGGTLSSISVSALYKFGGGK